MPPPLELTYYTDVDYTIPDYSSTTNYCKAMWWTVKAALKGTVLNTNAVVGTQWTLKYSCDSATAGTANDGVDRIGDTFDASKIVRTTGGGARSWAVFESPSALGPVYLCMDYTGSADNLATWAWSKTAFTGGTTTARPTSTDEFVSSVFAFCETGVSAAAKVHKIVTSSGHYILMNGRTGLGKPSHAQGFLPVTEIYSGDVWPFFGFVDAGSSSNGPFHANQNSWRAGTSPSMRTRTWNGGTAVNLAPLAYSYSSSTGADFLGSLMTASDQADGKYIDLPVYAGVVTSGTTYSLKGRLYDIRWTHSGIGDGTMFQQADGTLTHVKIGSSWVPCTVQPTF